MHSKTVISKRDTLVAGPPALARKVHPVAPRPRARALTIALATVGAVFALPLVELARFALASDLYSYILLIPFVSGYILWGLRRALRRNMNDVRPSPGLAIVLLTTGVGILATATIIQFTSAALSPEDAVALTTISFVLSLAGIGALWVGRTGVRTLAFPLGFLLFMAPLPAALLGSIETFMQHGSAAVAHALFDLSGTAVFYQSLIFQLPGISLHVAPECSGIRSTLVLFIVSVITGYLFLRSPGKRAWLALAVVPLALLRNGFRIFTIGELCVHYGPEMIDSYIHRHGGPFFFALSLVPLFALLLLLQRREKVAKTA